MSALKSHRAFTLIELLVVILVVLVLAVLSVPAAMKIYDRACEAGCAANLRQIGVAFNLLLNDTGGKFPPYQDETTDVWYNKLRPYLEVDSTKSISITRPGVFKCPANPGHRWDFSKLSYAYNIYLGMNDGISIQNRVPRYAITHPSEVILCADGDSREDTHNSYLDRSWRGPGVIHRGGANFLYVDGHVAWHLRDAHVAPDSWTEEVMRNRGAFGRYSY